MPFIAIDNILQRSVKLHNIGRLGHDTVFWNLHFYMPNVIFEESLVFFFFFFFHAISVSLLSIFIATAYGILHFTAKIEIKI